MSKFYSCIVYFLLVDIGEVLVNVLLVDVPVLMTGVKQSEQPICPCPRSMTILSTLAKKGYLGAMANMVSGIINKVIVNMVIYDII